MAKPAAGRAEWILSAVAEHQGRLIRFALRITGDLEAARDVVQDTFLRLCREDPAHVGSVPAWLFRVCRNRAVDVRRKEGPLERIDDAAAAPSEGDGPHALLERDEGIRRVRRELSSLGPAMQEVLRLRFQEELSYKEIAEVTGKSVSHVGVLIHDGVKELRRRLSAATEEIAHD
jgi:RNA polymerase sigma factor (sigma-70 family)